MASVLHFFLVPEDELGLFRTLERHRLEVYPLRVPPDWVTFLATAATLPRVPEDAAYLAAADLAPVIVDKVKRGKDKGSWRVDEVRSPVIYFERSVKNEDGDLISGKIWAELDITQQTGRRDPAPDAFRKVYLDVEEWFKKVCRKSEPIGFYVGPHAARAYKEGLVLRDQEPPKKRKKGVESAWDGTVRPYR